MSLPDDFKCPISLEIMSDPVILSSGHTFDRSSIQRWLDNGHRTCPITKLPLPDPPCLIPNHALRSLISNFTLVSLPKPQQWHHDPQSLIQTLIYSPSDSSEAKLNSLEQLSRVSKRDLSIRKRLIESGGVSAVLNCVNSDDYRLQEKSLHLLLNLSLDDHNKVGLVAEGVVGKVVTAVHNGAGDSRAVAATILTSLSVVEVNKATIGAYPGAIPGLVSLLRTGNNRERKEAATALYTLCSFTDNRIRTIDNQAIPILIQNLSSGLERAVEVLGLLSKCKEGRNEMMEFDDLLQILINIIKNGSSRGVQYALLTMNALCNSSELLCIEALREGVFELCVGFLDDDNEKLRRNAKCLIQVLQGKRF